MEHSANFVCVGDLRAWHVVEVICPRCGRRGRVPAKLLSRWPGETLLAALEAHFRCRRCRHKGRTTWRVMRLSRD